MKFFYRQILHTILNWFIWLGIALCSHRVNGERSSFGVLFTLKDKSSINLQNISAVIFLFSYLVLVYGSSTKHDNSNSLPTEKWLIVLDSLSFSTLTLSFVIKFPWLSIIYFVIRSFKGIKFHFTCSSSCGITPLSYGFFTAIEENMDYISYTPQFLY